MKQPKTWSEKHSRASAACRLPPPSVRWGRLLPVHSNPGASLLWASTQQHESLSTGYACPMDRVAVVCPVLTIPSSPCGLWPQNLERIPVSLIQEPARVQMCVGLLHRCFHTSQVARLPTGVLERTQCCPRLVCVHSPAPDQVCHQEEIGSNGRRGRARPCGQGCRWPSLLPSLEACTQVALNVDLGVPGAQSVRYFRTAAPLPALGLSPVSRS